MNYISFKISIVYESSIIHKDDENLEISQFLDGNYIL